LHDSAGKFLPIRKNLLKPWGQDCRVRKVIARAITMPGGHMPTLFRKIPPVDLRTVLFVVAVLLILAVWATKTLLPAVAEAAKTLRP
jgi:hypothetical protein